MKVNNLNNNLNKQPQQNNEPNHPKPSRFPKDKHVYFYDPESSYPNHCYGKIKNVIYQNESYYYEILIRPSYTIPIKENKVFMSTGIYSPETEALAEGDSGTRYH